METRETKLCKHCQTEIPKKAKRCPNCRKKQGGKVKWVMIAFVVILIIGAAGGGGEDDSKVKKVGETEESQPTEKNNQTQEKSNIFSVGDIVETDNFRITFMSAEVYVSDNQFLQPKDGYEYWKFEFEFENKSDSDQTVSSLMDWECYADNSKTDQTYIGDDNGLDATLSSGRTTQGCVYFEVPIGAESIELEYDINFWQDDKVVFVGK